VYVIDLKYLVNRHDARYISKGRSGAVGEC
jgi:hypothetical protein